MADVPLIFEIFATVFNGTSEQDPMDFEDAQKRLAAKIADLDARERTRFDNELRLMLSRDDDLAPERPMN